MPPSEEPFPAVVSHQDGERRVAVGEEARGGLADEAHPRLDPLPDVGSHVRVHELDAVARAPVELGGEGGVRPLAELARRPGEVDEVRVVDDHGHPARLGAGLAERRRDLVGHGLRLPDRGRRREHLKRGRPDPSGLANRPREAAPDG